jgi:hypothetical protein
MNVISSTRLLASMAAIGFATAWASAAYAATDGTPVSRADVKEQTRAANKAGELLAAGELNAADKPMPVTSSKSRAQQKAEVLAANRNGALGASGENLYKGYNVAPREALAHSTKTRAERKTETLQAARNHQLMPAGEAG